MFKSEQIANALGNIASILYDIKKLLQIEEVPERVTSMQKESDGSKPVAVGVDIGYIREWKMFDNETLIGHYSNGDKFAYYGADANNIMLHLAEAGRVYSAGVEKGVNYGTDTTGEPDHDPYL